MMQISFGSASRGQMNETAVCEIMDGLQFVTSLKRLDLGYFEACDIISYTGAIAVLMPRVCYKPQNV
jgi:hypothetical protein